MQTCDRLGVGGEQYSIRLEHTGGDVDARFVCLPDCMAGVVQQVEQHLLHPGRIGAYHGLLGAGAQLDPDAFRDGGGMQFHGFLDEGIQGEDFHRDMILTRKSEQLFDHVRTAEAQCIRTFQFFKQCVIVTGHVARQEETAGDAAQHIVEIVRDATDLRAERLHLLRLIELHFQ
ncbi:MAG: hypothetical protein AUK36_10490 [Zetaproteobacteria bacterium CG2_30_59_37]|nr:MAG: hypothetical protein AUK36_10490 [Zetaproteobacteria bacterium CG2_30_59_37]